jgi:hypothetical protein
MSRAVVEAHKVLGLDACIGPAVHGAGAVEFYIFGEGWSLVVYNDGDREIVRILFGTIVAICRRLSFVWH